MRNPKARSYLDPTSLQLGHTLVELRDAVDEYGLITVKVPGQQERRRIWAQAQHRDPSSKRLDGEDQFAPQTVGEALDVCGDLAAWQVYEVELLEHGLQTSPAPGPLGIDPALVRVQRRA